MKTSRLQMTLSLLLLAGLLWGSAGAVSAQAPAEAGFFEDLAVQPGAQFEVPVEVRAVEDLYAIDIEVRFDPAILQAEDADPNMEGVQAGLGMFLEAGLLLVNEVDNAEGVFRFAMTQVNPAEPVSGDGILLVLYFVAQAAGESELEVSFLEAATRLGEEITLEASDGLVTVAVDAPVFEATPIPTQDPELVIPIPTLAPTPTATVTPEPVAEPTATAMPEEVPAEDEAYPGPDQVEEAEAYPAEEEEVERRASILDYWWAVLIVIVLAGGLAAYLLVSKKRTDA
jgi:hypothetical protein